MGWFDEQIRLRKQSDQEVFEDSIIRMASSVLGGRGVGAINDRRVITKAAIDEILNYYRFRPTEIPEDIEDLDEQLEFCLRPHGVMHRSVRLAGKWYADAFGPMLGFLKEDSRPVALLPRPFMGYWFHDPDTGEKKRLDRRTAELFDEDAVCFYLPLPPKKLGVADLIVYMKNCLSASDIILVVALSLISSLVTLILPNITRFITGSVLDQRNMPMLIGTAMFLVSVTISSLLIDTVRSLSMGRLEIKTSLSVEAAVMSRVMNLPPRFFRQYSSGELSSRLDAVSQLCGLLLGNVFSLGLTSLMSLLHITQIFRFAPALVAPSLLLIAATVGIGLISALMQMKIAKRRMELAAKENGMSFALISGVQKIKLAGAEKRAFSRWARAFTASAELSYNPPMFIKVSGVIATAVSLVGTMVIYYLAVKTRVSASEYIAFSSSYGIVTGAFSSLTSVALTVASIKPILEMAEPIMRSEPESAENKAMVTQLSGNRLRKIHAHAADAWVRDSGKGRGILRRQGYVQAGPSVPAPAHRRGDAGREPLPGRYLLQYRDLGSAAHARGGMGGRGDRRHRRRYPGHAHGNADRHRRGAGRDLRRAEAATDDRPRRRPQAEDPDVRRGHLRAGQPDAEAGVRRAGQAQVHAHRHRAPAVHHPQLRPYPGAGQGAYHGRRHLRRTDRQKRFLCQSGGTAEAGHAHRNGDTGKIKNFSRFRGPFGRSIVSTVGKTKAPGGKTRSEAPASRK